MQLPVVRQSTPTTLTTPTTRIHNSSSVRALSRKSGCPGVQAVNKGRSGRRKPIKSMLYFQKNDVPQVSVVPIIICLSFKIL